MLSLDHLTVIAPTLTEGVEHVSDCLGNEVPFGTRHHYMGTHNHRLQVGENVYLEIVALDPDGVDPGRARWFGVDDSGQVRSDCQPTLCWFRISCSSSLLDGCDEPEILRCSNPQFCPTGADVRHYPFTGHESDTANLVDVPLSAGSNSTGFRTAISEHWLPALQKFRPQCLLISAGFDAHVLDDMSSLALTDADYTWITAELNLIAQKHCNGRIVSLLEGGYDLTALPRSVVAHLKELL